MAGRRRNQSSSALLLLAAAVHLVLFASTATAQQNCSSATFSSGRSFQRCTALPTLNASLSWTYHPSNGTADVAFRAPPPSGTTTGWVGWGINPDSTGMVGSSVFVASQDSSGSVSVLTTYLNSLSPSLTNGTQKLDVLAGPAAEYSGGAYTIYATVALPGNSTVQNTVWQAGPMISGGGGIGVHPMASANLRSTQKLDFLSGGSPSNGTTGKEARGLLSRRNLRGFQG